jgi:hypothetical protein
LSGCYFDGQQVRSILFRDLMDLEIGKQGPKHKLYRLLFESTLCLVGRTGTGKTVLAHMVSQHLCVSRGNMQTYFIMAKSLDSLGNQTKDGCMKLYGTMIYDDCEMRSLQNTKLSKTDLLSLFHVQQGGSFIARYHDAILPKGVPKIMCQNNRKDKGVEISWFRDNDMIAADALMQGSLEGIRQQGDQDQALARRMIIFHVQDSLIDEPYWQHLRDREYEEILRLAGDRPADPAWNTSTRQRHMDADAPRSPRHVPRAKSVATSSA